MTKIINLQRDENRRFLCTKKGQQEIMGLAIVIILIMLAVLVIAKLSTNKEFSLKSDYEQSKLALGMINTLLTTTSRDCNGLLVRDVLQNCADNNANVCNTEDSCSYVEQQLQEIFANTLETWQVDYEFSSFYDERRPIIKLGKQCITKQSELYPLPTGSVVLFVRLDICR